jgi:hypothetical protein
VFADRLIASHREDIATAMTQFANQPGGDSLAKYFEGLLSAGQDSQWLRISVGFNLERAVLSVALSPKPGSRFSAFVQTQKPSDFKLLSRLPPRATTTMTMVGHMEMGPYRDGMIAAMSLMFGAAGNASGLAAAINEVVGMGNGDFALAFNMDPGAGLSSDAAYGISDPEKASSIFAKGLSPQANNTEYVVGSIKTRLVGVANAKSHADVAIHSTEAIVDLSTVPPEQKQMMERMANQKSEVAFTRGLALMSSGVTPDVRKAIDTVIGTSPGFVPNALFAEKIENARARKCSIMATMDLASFAAFVGQQTRREDNSEVFFALGVEQGNLLTQFDVPAAAIRSFIP